jgi:hypothetical protein
MIFSVDRVRAMATRKGGPAGRPFRSQRRLRVLIEPRDLWVGAYISRDAVHVVPFPTVVFRWARTYHKAAALIVRDKKMLVINSTMDPCTYSLPGARMLRTIPPVVLLGQALAKELLVEPIDTEMFGDYRVTSNIDSAPVHALVYTVDIGEQTPDPIPAGRRTRWVDGTRMSMAQGRLTTSAQAVLADAIDKGIVRGAK